MHYDVLGRSDAGAETVLLSSGLGGAAGYWAPQLGVLTERFRVITYDQRGTGRSAEALPAGYTIGAMADDVLAVLDEAGCGQCHFVGHALGGLVGLELALQRPERVSSLVLVNAWAKADPHTLRCFDVRRDILRDTGVAAYVRAQPIFLYPAAWLAQNAERAAAEEAHGLAHFQGTDNLLRRIEALVGFDVAGRLGEIMAPTLVMAARDDVLVPYTCSEQLAARLPSATLRLVEGGGHACNVTETDTFNAAVLAFWTSRGPV